METPQAEQTISQDNTLTQNTQPDQGGLEKKSSSALKLVGLGVAAAVLLVTGYVLGNSNSRVADKTKTVAVADTVMEKTEAVIQPVLDEAAQPQTVQTTEWVSYTIPGEKLSFSYPQDWKIMAKPERNEWYLISKNKFRIKFLIGAGGLGGYCDEECKKWAIPTKKIGNFQLDNKALNIIVNGLQDASTVPEFGKPFTRFSVIPKDDCDWNICYGFSGKNTVGEVIITGEYVFDVNEILNESNKEYMAAEDFIESTDVKTAIKIVESLKYN